MALTNTQLEASVVSMGLRLDQMQRLLDSLVSHPQLNAVAVVLQKDISDLKSTAAANSADIAVLGTRLDAVV